MRFKTRRGRIRFVVVFGPVMIALGGLVSLAIGSYEDGWTEYGKVTLGATALYAVFIGVVGWIFGWWRRPDGRRPPTR